MIYCSPISINLSARQFHILCIDIDLCCCSCLYTFKVYLIVLRGLVMNQKNDTVEIIKINGAIKRDNIALASGTGADGEYCENICKILERQVPWFCCILWNTYVFSKISTNRRFHPTSNSICTGLIFCLRLLFPVATVSHFDDGLFGGKSPEAFDA